MDLKQSTSMRDFPKQPSMTDSYMAMSTQGYQQPVEPTHHHQDQVQQPGTSYYLPTYEQAGTSAYNYHVDDNQVNFGFMADQPGFEPPEQPVKSEPPHQSSPAVEPIDMTKQEKEKLERKQMRNRIAAHKCRKRKLERISKLEDRVATLRSCNEELTTNIDQLRQEVGEIKQQVVFHMNSGCNIQLEQPFDMHHQPHM